MKSESENSNTNKIYGFSPIVEALKSGKRSVEQITIAEGLQNNRLRELLDLAKKNGVIISRAPKNILARYVEPGANHQGVVASIASAKYTDSDELLDELTRKIGGETNPLAIVLDGVEDPHNLGAVLRTVECAGADGVFIPERRAVGLTETVAKSSAGAIEYVPVAKVTNLNRLIEDLKERNIWTIGASADAKMDYTEWDWTQPSALIMGSEGKGLHRLVEENCDILVKIPMCGKIESLNVSVATGVILFEAIRQRKLKTKSD